MTSIGISYRQQVAGPRLDSRIRLRGVARAYHLDLVSGRTSRMHRISPLAASPGGG